MERKIIALALAIVLIAAGLAAGLVWLASQSNVPSEIRVGYITGDNRRHTPSPVRDRGQQERWGRAIDLP